jgi:hypothetical protein
VGSNVVGADTALALLVEQLEAVLHDALAGFHSYGHGLGFNSTKALGHLTTYRPEDKPKAVKEVI